MIAGGDLRWLQIVIPTLQTHVDFLAMIQLVFKHEEKMKDLHRPSCTVASGYTNMYAA
jgi:hypothetical protein